LNAEPWSTRCGRRGTREVQERGALPRAAASPAGLGDVAFRGCGLVRVTHPSLFAPGLRGPAVAFTNYESRITNHQSPIPNHPHAKRRPEGSPFCVGALVAGAGFEPATFGL